MFLGSPGRAMFAETNLWASPGARMSSVVPIAHVKSIAEIVVAQANVYSQPFGGLVHLGHDVRMRAACEVCPCRASTELDALCLEDTMRFGRSRSERIATPSIDSRFKGSTDSLARNCEVRLIHSNPHLLGCFFVIVPITFVLIGQAYFKGTQPMLHESYKVNATTTFDIEIEPAPGTGKKYPIVILIHGNFGPVDR